MAVYRSLAAGMLADGNAALSANVASIYSKIKIEDVRLRVALIFHEYPFNFHAAARTLAHLPVRAGIGVGTVAIVRIFAGVGSFLIVGARISVRAGSCDHCIKERIVFFLHTGAGDQFRLLGRGLGEGEQRHAQRQCQNQCQ